MALGIYTKMVPLDSHSVMLSHCYNFATTNTNNIKVLLAKVTVLLIVIAEKNSSDKNNYKPANG